MKYMAKKKPSKTIKQLRRSNSDKVWAGLFGGIGEYFGIDPVILRLVFVMTTIFSGFFPGVVAYIVGSLIVPVR